MYYTVKHKSLLQAALLCSSCAAWTSLSTQHLSQKFPLTHAPLHNNRITTAIFSEKSHEENAIINDIHQDTPETERSSISPLWASLPLLASSTLLLLPQSAEAATGSPSPIPSALAAYGHYASLLVITAAIMVERLTIKPNMSSEEETRLAIADTTLGIAGVVLAYTGYLRAVSYGKGWDFYSHEPLFWVKITFVAIFGAVSFFPTTKIIQRSVARQLGREVPPMSEALAKRMASLMNAELLMVLSIPLTATLMARGVGYMNDFPWQVGAAVSAVALFGLGGKYISEALNWSEEEGAVKVVADESL